MSELAGVLRRRQTQLEVLTREIQGHPAVRLYGREPELSRALAKFELARRLREPIEQAEASMVERLITGPLQPILVELVAALTRFDWYFQPLQVDVTSDKLHLTGMASEAADLDVRLLLNSAEKAVLGIAWFLALYLLQAEEKRRLLILDDPLAWLDDGNQAAFVSVLRSLMRLTQPDLTVCSTHDPGLADILERELSPVGGWPAELRRLHCERSNGIATVQDVTAYGDQPNPERELERLERAGRPRTAQTTG
jgi:hypothetical protein